MQGQTLTERHGSWSNNPSSFGDQWDRCNAAGFACSPIAGATGQTHVLTAADAGHTIRVAETATNTGGASSSALSAPTAVVAQSTSTTIVTVGNQRLTLTTPSQQVCTARNTALRVALGSTTIPHSKAVKLRCSSATFYIDRGVKHTHRKTIRSRSGKRKTLIVVGYGANATTRRLPIALGLAIKGLKSGTHTLTIKVYYTQTEKKRGDKTKATVSKTLTLKFSVC